MHNTRIWALLIAITATLSAVSPSMATTLTGTVTPAGAGTKSAPKAQTVTFDTKDIKAGADGNPTSGATKLEQILPPDFISGFEGFATCDKAKITMATTKPDCPPESLLGTIQATLYLVEFRAKVNSDQGYVWKTGPDTFGSWVHVSKPIEKTGVGFGVVKPAADGNGPTAVFDPSSAAKGENQPVHAWLSRWNVAWRAAGTTPAAPKPTTQHKPKNKYKACMQKARRIKNKKKRAKAIRACKRAAKHRKSKARAAAATEGTAAFSPFESTACTGGSWTLQTHLEYLDGTNETVKSTVSCTSGAADGSGGAGSILDGILPPPAASDGG